mgnify:CR=1 FL=1
MIHTTLFKILLFSVHPWQFTLIEKVYQDVSNCLQIISPALLVFVMSVYRSVSRCPRELSLLSNIVIPSFWIYKPFRQPEIYGIYCIDLLGVSNQKIFRFYVSVQVFLRVHRLYP